MFHQCAVATAAFFLVVPIQAQDMSTSTSGSWPALMVSTASIIDMAKDQRAAQLEALGSALLDDPVDVADDLERSGGGKRALRAYAYAMIADGNVSQMVDQFHTVMHGGATTVSLSEVFNTPQSQDGSVWFPQAEQAGFFAGGIAAVLDGKDAAGFDNAHVSIVFTAIEQRFGVSAPQPQEKAGEWMLRAFTGTDSEVSVPAAQWFEKGFFEAYR